MNRLHVVFRVHETEYVLSGDDVLHMESFEAATPVPGAPPWVAGLLQIRGRVVPVVDLRARFGLPPAQPGLGTRVLVVRSGDRIAGLVVDSARDVMELDPDGFAAPPAVLARSRDGYIEAVARAGNRLLMRLDVARVLGEEGTQHAERAP